MKKEPPLGMNCTVLEDGTVIPFPGARGAMSESGLYRGNCRMMVVKGGTRTEGDLVVAVRAPVVEEGEDAALFNSRTVTFYWIQEIRQDGLFWYANSFLPVPGPHTYVAGNYSSVILTGPDFASYYGAPDPAQNITDIGLGWPIADYQAAPYYPIGGPWVEGFDPPYETAADVVPWFLNQSIGGMVTVNYNDGTYLWSYDIVPVTLTEYKRAGDSWPTHYEYP